MQLCKHKSGTVAQTQIESLPDGQNIIFGGKLGNLNFCHIFGMERQFLFV